ncbi:MAG: bifunctional oligoribonuclease/PAP phosphatase NrnA [Lachnospiraceae bacterium]|nr:bifunctional oligoribonuclease/PAP phosphatase NrnA [Lachnospiraceae bacterium]
MNNILLNEVEKASSIGITGHIHPDGDCVGSCMALYHYIRKVYPEKTVKVFLEAPADNMRVAEGINDIDSGFTKPENPFDLFVVLDCSSADRFEPAKELVEAASKVFVVDHHMTNTHFADEGVILPDASSTCEVLYDLFEDEKIDRTVATFLYLGIIHDTGVFRFPACTEHTMNIAGRMLTKGVNAQQLIDDSFYRKTYAQNRLIGDAVARSELLLDGKMIYTAVTLDDLARFGAGTKETEGLIDQLRLTKGIEVAMFARQEAEDTYKISLRAISKVNVASICAAFGGGGHKFAAGCTVTGNLSDYVTQISAMVLLQL